MEFKIIEGYYTVTLTKRLQFVKQNNFLKRFGDIKIKLTSSLTLYLTFRIFDTLRHHSILGAFMGARVLT